MKKKNDYIFSRSRLCPLMRQSLKFLLLLSVLMLAGCGSKLGTVEAPVPEPQSFSYTGQDVIPEEWWRAFEDEQLNRLMDSALTKNLNLASVWQQFQAAKAGVRIAGSNLWPQVEATLQSGISRPQPDFAGGENTQAGISASYEVDLWGRLNALQDAEVYRAKASYYDYQTAAMSLSAELSSAYFSVLTASKQLKLVNEQIEINEKIMKLIRNRFGSGQIRAVDILRQEQLLETTRGLAVSFERELALAQNRLDVLLGIPAQNDYVLEFKELPDLSPLPETGLPLELTRRRPDLQSAYERVKANDREYAAALSNRYPRLSFRLSGQVRSNTYTNLFREWAYSLAGNLVAPLFYGGRLQAEADQAEAFKQSAVYDYGQTVLVAFREVEDALVNEQKQKDRLEILERQLELTEKTNKQIRFEFFNGLSDYLDVLLALDEQQQLKRDQIRAEQQLIEFRINLYRALAGGFETRR